MWVTEEKPRFSPRTGEPNGTVRTTRHYRCDYCGEILPETEEDDPGLVMQLNYRDGIDTCFGSSGTECDFSEKHDVDMYDLLGHPYCFCNLWNDVDQPCERALAMEFAGGGPAPDGMPSLPNEDMRDLQGAFRAARVRVAAKLIADGVVAPQDLGL